MAVAIHIHRNTQNGKGTKNKHTKKTTTTRRQGGQKRTRRQGDHRLAPTAREVSAATPLPSPTLRSFSSRQAFHAWPPPHTTTHSTSAEVPSVCRTQNHAKSVPPGAALFREQQFETPPFIGPIGHQNWLRHDSILYHRGHADPLCLTPRRELDWSAKLARFL